MKTEADINSYDLNGIFLSNVTKYYRIHGKKNLVIDNETIYIPPAKNVGILGNNGSGKSTFLRLLGGIDFPNSGKILSNKKFSWPLALSGGFQGSLSGLDNARFVARIYGKRGKSLKKTTDFINEFAEIGDYFYEPVKTYSSGMKAKLGFAMSIAFDFDYYLIDETISVGDKNFKDKCAMAISNITAKRNVVMVSHDTSVLRRMCDVGIVIDKGKLFYYDTINEAIEKYETI